MGVETWIYEAQKFLCLGFLYKNSTIISRSACEISDNTGYCERFHTNSQILIKFGHQRSSLKIPSQPTTPSSRSDTSRERSQVAVTETQRPAPISGDSRTLLRVPLKDIPLVVQNTVPLEQLKQPVGQQIIARVIGELKGENLIVGRDVDLPKNSNTAKEATANVAKQPTATAAPANVEGQAKQVANEILLKIGSQYLLITTRAPVASNDSIAVVINENNTLSVITKPTTTEEQQAKLLQTIRTVLSQTLPQQVSLKTGLSALNEIASKSIDSALPFKSPAGTKPKLGELNQPDNLANIKAHIFAKLAAQVITDQLPKSDALAKLFNPSPEVIPQQALSKELNALVKTWLNNSGVSLESKLMSSSIASQPSQQAQQTLSQVWQVMSQATAQANSADQNTAGTKTSNDNIQLWLKAAKYVLTYRKMNVNTTEMTTVGELSALQKTPAAWQALTDQIERFNSAANKVANEANALLKLFETVSNSPTLQASARVVSQLDQSMNVINANSEVARSALDKLNELPAMLTRQNTQSTSTQQGTSSAAVDAAVEALNQQIMLAKAHPALAGTQGSQDLKAALQQAIVNISAADPSAGSKTASEGLLRQAVSDISKSSSKTEISGLLEPNLLKQPFDFPRMDNSILKAQALMADQELSTGQLLKLMAAMINRIQFNQANSLYQAQTAPDQSIAQSWNIELPYVHANQTQAIQVRIDQRNGREQTKEHDEQGKEKQWTIQLAFNLDIIGPMHIRAELAPPSVTAQVWVANKNAKALIEREKSKLINRLEQVGLKVETPQCHIGKPSQEVDARIKQGLVDTRA